MPAASALPVPPLPLTDASGDEARFVADLASRWIAARMSAGDFSQVNASVHVENAIGLLREARRQLAEARAEETAR